MDKNEAELKIKELKALINDTYKQIATIGVEADVGVYLELPNGYNSVSLVTRSYLEDTLSNYGWEASDGEEISLEEAFEKETGIDVRLGEWISSSVLC